MYNKKLIGSRPSLKGDTVKLVDSSGKHHHGTVVQDGCSKSLIQFGNERDWYPNELLTLVRSHPRNKDYRAND